MPVLAKPFRCIQEIQTYTLVDRVPDLVGADVESTMGRVSRLISSGAVLCSVHVGSEGTDEDGGEEDTVATDESAFRNVSLCYANGPARVVGAYL